MGGVSVQSMKAPTRRLVFLCCLARANANICGGGVAPDVRPCASVATTARATLGIAPMSGSATPPPPSPHPPASPGEDDSLTPLLVSAGIVIAIVAIAVLGFALALLVGRLVQRVADTLKERRRERVGLLPSLFV